MIASWQLQPIFDSPLLVLGLLAALVALTWWSTRELAISNTRRRWIAALRLVWIVGLALLMFRPTLVRDEQDPRQRTVLILLDQSLSMTTEDMDGGSRWNAAAAMLARVWPEIEALKSRLRFDFFRFDREAKRAEAETVEQLTQQPPDGDETDLGSSLQDAVLGQSGSQLVAAIMLSDGAQRVVQPRIEVFDAARQVQRMGAALYAVPLGKATDPEDARDVALLELPDQFRVFAKTEWTLQGQVDIQGYVNQAMPVLAVLESADGQRIELPTQEVSATPTQTTVDYEFVHVPETPGQYKLTVSVPHQPGETVTDNNQLLSYLTVLEGGVRVLLLESNWIAPEFKFRRRAIGSAPALEIDELLIDWREQWPRSLPPDVDLSKYDVFVVGDVHADALRPEVWQAIAERVEQGGGLIMTGGIHAFGAGGFSRTALNDVLPVVMDRLERQDPRPDAPASPDLQLGASVPMLPTASHFVVRLGSGVANRSAWEALPPLASAYKFRSLKPNAITLAASPEGAPLLVASQYGLGRVLAFAGDSTYRWWLRGFADQHQRFWRQVVLWLANKEDLARHELVLRPDRRRVLAGTDLGIEVLVRDEGGQAVPDAEVTLAVKDPEGKTSPVRLRLRGDSLVAVLPRLSTLGEYQLTATAQVGDEPLSETAQLVVFRQDWERLDPAANPDQLRRMAEITSDQGGRLLAPEELVSVLHEIADRPLETAAAYQRRWQFGDTWWDALLAYLVIGAALAGEWYLRKSWGLV